jgi:NAD(P)-dependent dehydrogenase (short-subunit alcohol dehydrogenase family)
MPRMSETMKQSSPFHLRDEIALISGGGTGLGFAIAAAMIEAGAQVVLAGRREATLEEAAEKLGPSAHTMAMDLMRTEELDAKIAVLARKVGPVTLLVNNAGIHLKKRVGETSVDEFDAIWNTHVRGAFALTRAVLPAMLERKHGSILFIASMTSLIGMPQVVAYSAAKSAYLGMVRSLAVELSPDGVRVNAIAPGWIETPMLRQAIDSDPKRKERILARTPLGHFGEPQDIGQAAVYLASAAAKFVTGVVLPVDGGASIGF